LRSAEPVANGLALMAAVYLTTRAFLNIVDGVRRQAAEMVKVENIIRAAGRPPDRRAALQSALEMAMDEGSKAFIRQLIIEEEERAQLSPVTAPQGEPRPTA
jgi:hypothetical protein